MAKEADPVRELIRSRLAELGITMADASKRIGKNAAYIQQFLERGTPVKLPEDVRDALAPILGVAEDAMKAGGNVAAVPSSSSRPVIPQPRPPLNRELIPVLGTAEGGPDGAFPWNGDIVDHVPRPPYLAGASNAYALYVSGESMLPRYEPGEMIFVHPGRPVVIGSYVVVQIKSGSEGEPPLAYIKRLARRSAAKIVLEQFNPHKEIEFKLAEVVALHRIVGSGDY